MRDIDPEIMRAAVETAIVTRRSVRGFRPTPVGRETVERLLSTLDELLGHLNAECGSRVDAEPGR